MKGKDVKELQRLLAGSNKFGKNFHPGKIDGDYGPYSAAATRRAKYALGYPSRALNTSAGRTLYRYLSGSKALPATYIARARYRRRKAAAATTMRGRALQYAMKKKGLTETPQGSNRNWLTRWYYGNDTAAPWCAISVTHSYIAAGSKAFKRGSNYAYVPYMENAANAGSLGFARIAKADVRPGDIVTFNFDGGVADHVGIFVKWTNKVSGTFVAIEGNTDTAGGANGGEQMLRNRGMNLVSQFIRVKK